MDARLFEIFSELKSDYLPAEKYDLRVSFYPYKNINHTIRLRKQTIFVRISDKLSAAPDEILLSIGTILFDKLFRIKPDKAVQKVYRNYIQKNIIPILPKQKKEPSGYYTPSGKYYNLTSVFNAVNARYFNNSIPQPTLGWSLNNSYRRLAFYDHERDLIVVSRIFDKRSVPEYVIAFLMYHEMLHIIIPVKKVNGRRIIHPAEFKEQERFFAEYDKVQRWLSKKRRWTWF